MAFSSDTVINSIGGPIELREVALLFEFDPDGSLPVFGWDGSRIVVVNITACRPVGSLQLFDVLIDSGDSIKASARTKFVRRDGSSVAPIGLNSNESLLPLYTKVDHHGYTLYKHLSTHYRSAPAPADRSLWRKVSRLIAEWKLGESLLPGTYVEHIDGDRSNAMPSNIRIDHRPDQAKRSSCYGIVDAVNAGQAIIREFNDRKSPDNHKVECVEAMSPSAAIEIFVDSHDTIAVSGVFIQL